MAAPPRHGVYRSGPRRGPVSTVVGVVGELLITLGVLLGLFVVWQLWWTDVQAQREHAEILSELEWPAPGGGSGEGGTEGGPPPPVAPPQEGEPPALDEPFEGSVFAELYVPRWGDDYVSPIAHGVDKASVLDRLGIGHYPGTAMPGELGNFAVAGHRTTYGKPLNRVHELRVGDPLVVRTAENWYVYRVTDWEIVWPNQVEVISAVPGVAPGEPLPELTQRFMTMTACHPMYSAAQRWVVYSELDYWAPVSEGVPAELVDAGVNVRGA